eukprot:3748395-Alexandrium_andersonii.AAC.1
MCIRDSIRSVCSAVLPAAPDARLASSLHKPMAAACRSMAGQEGKNTYSEPRAARKSGCGIMRSAECPGQLRKSRSVGPFLV